MVEGKERKDWDEGGNEDRRDGQRMIQQFRMQDRLMCLLRRKQRTRKEMMPDVCQEEK